MSARAVYSFHNHEPITMKQAIRRVVSMIVPATVRQAMLRAATPAVRSVPLRSVLGANVLEEAARAAGCTQWFVAAPAGVGCDIERRLHEPEAVRRAAGAGVLFVVCPGLSAEALAALDDAASGGAQVISANRLRLLRSGTPHVLLDSLSQPPSQTAVDRSELYSFRIRLPSLNLLYYEVPKNASSTLKAVLFGLERDRRVLPEHQRLIRPAVWQKAFPHMVARHGDPGWASHFKFAFLRNPYARIFSSYKNAGWHFRYEGETFQAFVRGLPEIVERPDDLVSIHHKPFGHFVPKSGTQWALDFIGKVETIERDLGTILYSCGIREVPRLPIINPSGSDDYREHYDSDTRAIVARLYAEEIELGGYRF